MQTDNFDYPVKILSFHCDEKKDFIIKYQYCHKRVADVISLSDFLNSPLIFGTHPLQLYYLGLDSASTFSSQSLNAAENQASKPANAGRLKRIFNHG